jgi:hypothetical protein
VLHTPLITSSTLPLTIIGLSLSLHRPLTRRHSDTPILPIFHYSHRSSFTHTTG